MSALEPLALLEELKRKYPGTSIQKNWGESALFYNPRGVLKKGIYLCTIKHTDGENDSASNLTSQNAYRLNICVSKKTFEALFGEKPNRPAAGKTVQMDFDFTKMNVLLPHPVYAWMSWVCIINPVASLQNEIEQLIDESYELAKVKYLKRRIE